MTAPQKPVIVFHARNELEAQRARDVLSSEMIPLIHLPSVSTGLFALPQTTRVAVPPDYVEKALAALEEAGMPGQAEEAPRGLDAVREAISDRFPIPGSALPEGSRLRRVLIGLAVVILALAVLMVITRS